MIKAFLSHSSADKLLVENVASQIGRNFGIVDKFFFESGRDLIKEINDSIDICSLFVLFISNASLESLWVKTELQRVRDLYDEEKTDITAFIIDPTVSVDDVRIKPWIKRIIIDEVRNPIMIARIIQRNMRERIWKNDLRVDLRKRIFVGRNTELEQLQRKFYERLGSQPRAIIVSGLKHIGRKRLLSEFFIQRINSGMHSTYEPVFLSLEKDDQLDEFVLQLSEYCSYSREYVIESLRQTAQGCELAIRMLNELATHKEVVLIEDDLSIVLSSGRLSEWFNDLINSGKLEQQLYIMVASKCSVVNSYYYSNPFVLSIKLSPLQRLDLVTLFNQYATLLNLKCSREDVDKYVDAASGYPELVFDIVDNLVEKGEAYTDGVLNDISIRYDKDFSRILDAISEKDGIIDFCALLAHFEYVSFEVLSQVISQDIMRSYLNLLDRYALYDVFGSSKQYIRLNSLFSDYISRNRIQLPQKYVVKLQELVERLLKNVDDELLDLSEQLMRIKYLLKSPGYNVPEKYLLPSYALKVIVEQYNAGEYPSVIQIADRVLNDYGRHNYKSVNEAVRYWQCLAYCRENNPQALKEAESFVTNGEHQEGMYHFIKGFYYRLLGKYGIARSEFEKVLADVRNIHARFLFKAEHELVIALMQLKEYGEALQHAKNCYERDSQNPYNVDAYFRCYVRSSQPDRDELKRLIERMKSMSWNKSWQNSDVIVNTYHAEYYYFVETDPMRAIAELKEIIETSEGKVVHYPLGVLKEICDRQQMMEVYRRILKEARLEDREKGFVLEELDE